ncbi:MAG TPA: nickel pincer cofactor biosynthesis protein LarC [Spirochaetota bacterium]|nr:nickel pincer cofactor biosynthesis protein LarC [Spirochaetota bacterium]HPQ52389.1 nickel pincer cofactor biosynthesis protein LarC [Spirochaetota bacterium]
MGKILYFDIQLGASGDMLLGSLLDLGLDHGRLTTELRTLTIDGWEMAPAEITRNHIRGITAGITCSEDSISRNLSDILGIIQKSSLSKSIRDNVCAVFTRLGKAEARVHGERIEDVHFHEVGALDSIIDITAFCIAVDILQAETILFSEFCFGTGTINSRHGEIPVPVPAVVELTKGFSCRHTRKQGELVTPTAAAILTALGTQVGTGSPGGRTIDYGIGFGTRQYPFPSYTRSIISESDDRVSESLILLECNIDDMNPQLAPYLMESLLRKGALDVTATPAIMKKGRPGLVITVLSEEQYIETLKEILYRESTTLGLRIERIEREKLQRRYHNVTVCGHTIGIKTGVLHGETVNIQPEYEDCKKAAENTGMTLQYIMQEAMRIFRDS